MSSDEHTILHGLRDQHEWACAWAAVETFRATDGVGLYGPRQAITYEYAGRGGEWHLAVWRDSEGIHCARIDAD